MKPVHAVLLNEWITNNRATLTTSERGTLGECATRACGELGFKVPTGTLASLMRSQGIETRRLSARQGKELAMRGEIESLTAENLELRRTLAKVWASEYVPDDFKEFVFAGLKEEIKAAIRSVNQCRRQPVA